MEDVGKFWNMRDMKKMDKSKKKAEMQNSGKGKKLKKRK